ncbi:MAG: hypothetical protein ACQERB_12015 [Promethearchaeati archaeon]
MKCKVLEVERGKKAEENINKWLNTIPEIDIKFITQTIKGSLLITTVFYEDSSK